MNIHSHTLTEGALRRSEPRSLADFDAELTGRSVLVIDDDASLLDLMGIALEDAGATVTRAADGLAGIKAFAASPSDVVVTDILMPTKEGIETLIEIKRLAPGVKIVAISGGSRVGAESFLVLARRLGADATLSKPFRLADLVESCAVLAERAD